MKFSIVTVALNPGDKLQKTLDSVFCQTCTDYEIILKDGGSTDGSMDRWREVIQNFGTAGKVEKQGRKTLQGRKALPGETEACSRVCFLEKSDKGIYDAMNQAVQQAAGDFVLFLNCGDMLADANVLERAAEQIDRSGEQPPLILYGDTVSAATGATIASPPKITGFTCYRNIPCHQSCFYSRDLCREKPYDLQYKIRADYDHFLWCRYRGGAKFLYLNFPVSSYEGGGYSESRENAERDRKEHKRITEEYMSGPELFCYRAVMALTLAPLRRRIAGSRLSAGLYQRLKKLLYGGRKA